MATMFVRHTVSDYKAWRKVYDDFASTQKAMGVTAEAVYQSADNPNDITVTTTLPRFPRRLRRHSNSACALGRSDGFGARNRLL
jgi:hypothetical protein